MVLSKAVFLTIKACNRFKSSGQAMVFFLVAMLGLFLCATPAFAAGGSCPNGNNTIDPQGNPISITNVGVTGAVTGGDQQLFLRFTGYWVGQQHGHRRGPPMETCAGNVRLLEHLRQPYP